MALSCIQLNQNRSFSAAVELNNRLRSVENYICFITEPFRAKCKVAARPSGSRVLVVKEQIPPRAAIFVKGNCEVIMIESLSNTDCAVGMLKIGTDKVLVASVYLDITKDVVPKWLEDLCVFAESKQMPLLLGADWNAHSMLYGNDSNRRGEEFEEFIIKHGLFVENQGTEPTFSVTRLGKEVSSCIDVTLSRGFGERVNNWRVEERFNGSDHRTLYFDVDMSTEIGGIWRRNWPKTNWKVFADKLENNRRFLYVPENIDEKKLDRMVNKLYKCINLALDEASPMVRGSVGRDHFEWYDEDHKRLSQKVNRAYIKYVKNRSELHYERYKKLALKYKNKCRRDRSRAWKKFSDQLREAKDIARISKALQGKERSAVNLLELPDGSVRMLIRDASPLPLAAQLAGFGTSVELIDPPPEIVVELQRIATELATRVVIIFIVQFECGQTVWRKRRANGKGPDDITGFVQRV